MSLFRPTKFGLWNKSARSWASRGFWAVADQGLFAGSNFLLNVLLARWLTPAEYGAFGIAFAVFLLLGCVYQGVLEEPMLVFGASRFEGRFGSYVGTLIYGHIGFVVIVSSLLLICSQVFRFLGAQEISMSFLVLSVCGPCMLLLWLMRRACYVQMRPELAASGGAWYMVLVVSGAFLLYRYELLAVWSAFGVMALGSLLVSLWLIHRLRVRLPSLRGEKIVGDSLVNHWRYGRWAVVNQCLNWIPSNIFFLFLPIWGGLEATASLRALMNLLMPIIQANASLSVLLIPFFVTVRDGNEFGGSIRIALLLFIAAPLLYWLFLGLFNDQLVSWVYGSRYAEVSPLLWILGVVPLIYCTKLVFSQALNAMEKPDCLFRALLASAICAVFVGGACVFLWSLSGAVIGFLAALIVATVTAGMILMGTLRGRLIPVSSEEVGEKP